MADQQKPDDSLYPIAVLIDELKNEDIQVSTFDNYNLFIVDMTPQGS